MLGSASVQLGVDPSVARYLPNHTLSRVPPPAEQHHLAAVEHQQHAHTHPHYPQITDAGASEPSASAAAGMDGNAAVDGHHFHVQHQQGQSQGNGVPVPYEHDYASSSHTVFHQHGEYEPATAETSHSQIDPSLRPQVRAQDGQHDVVVGEAPEDFEVINGDRRQQAPRFKKRRRVKDGSGGSGTNATAESPASKIAKRRKKDLAASPVEEDELQQHPPSPEHDGVQNGFRVDDERPQKSSDVSTSHAANAVQTDGYLVNT